MNFPSANDFYDRFCKAVVRSGREQDFLNKWGLGSLDDVHEILNNNVQGGYASHKESIMSGNVSGSVLTIGPGMGFCVFLLSEMYDHVYAAEPDGENCSILRSITPHYITGNNKAAGDISEIYHAGIAITEEAIKYWDMKQQLMKKRHLKGSILNFDIHNAQELGQIFSHRVSRVYLHKVISSFSIATSFEHIITQAREFLLPMCDITWSEPGYIFADILGFENDNTGRNMLQNIKPVFDKLNMSVDVIPYLVFNGEGENRLEETWMLIKARRND